MIDLTHYADVALQPDDALTRQVKDTIQRGRDYVAAFRFLDPRLAQIDPEHDLAVGFDIGAGADAIAFGELGFKRTTVTNSCSAVYNLAYNKSAEREDEVRRQVRQNFPPETYISNLSVLDWLEVFERRNTSPRLLTMLRMAPGYFGNEDPAFILKRLIELAHLRENCTMVLSALDDHHLSAQAFTAAAEFAQSLGVPHQLFIDDSIPKEASVLGSRILVIKK